MYGVSVELQKHMWKFTSTGNVGILEKKKMSRIILFIPQGSVRVSAVPVGLGTTDAQPAHLWL